MVNEYNSFIKSKSLFISIDENKSYSELIDFLRSNTEFQYQGIYFLHDNDKSNSIELITDGDIRRGLIQGLKLSSSLKEFTRDSFFSINLEDILKNSPEDILEKIKHEIYDSGLTSIPRYIPLTKDGQLASVLDYTALQESIQAQESTIKTVAVIGLGYVGLTLAASLAKKNIVVVGYDIDDEIICNLNNGIVHIKEPRLSDIVKIAIAQNVLSFKHIRELNSTQAYIICVGSSVKNNELDDSAIDSVLDSIESVINPNQHIFLRSTVPVGFTRSLASNRFDSINKPFISFVPERTVEGNALFELDNIPQIIGSLNKKGFEKQQVFGQHYPTQSLNATALKKPRL